MQRGGEHRVRGCGNDDLRAQGNRLKLAGAAGFLCPWLEETWGGPGADWLCSVIVRNAMITPSTAVTAARPRPNFFFETPRPATAAIASDASRIM